MRRTLKYLLHDIIAPLMLGLGVDKILRRRNRNRRLIIMYHGVREGATRINGRHITDAAFENQLIDLKKKYRIVSLTEICDSKIDESKNDRHTVALTFDDGFLNNLTVAFPILQKHNVPATFFICSAGITDPSYLHPTDAIDVLRSESGGDQTGLNLSPRRRGERKETAEKGHSLLSVFVVENGHLLDENITRAGHRRAYQYINTLPFDQWLRETKALSKQVTPEMRKKNHDLCMLLDERSLLKLAQNRNTTIGSHSHHHVNLTRLNFDEATAQLSESKKILEATQDMVDTLAFPYGYFNEETISIARQQGYRYLIAGGHVDPPFKNDVFPRIGVLDGASVAYTLLEIANGFKRFGF